LTVPTTTSSVQYAGTGTTDTFSITWSFAQNADIKAYTIVPATGVITNLVLTTDFTLTGAGVYTGGTLTLVAGNLPTGTTLFIESDPAEVQLTLLAQNAPTDPAAIMAALDLLTREVQALRRRVNNSIQIPVAESLDGYDMALPAAVDRENTIVAFNASGVLTPVTTGGLVPSPASFATVTDESATLANARQITVSGALTITDHGPGAQLELGVVIPPTLKLPITLNSVGGITILQMAYDDFTDNYIGIGASTAYKFDGGSQGTLANLAGGTGINNLCIIPGIGKAFIGCSSQKLCILDIASMVYDVLLLQQDHDFGAGAVHLSTQAQVIYSPSEDKVYGFGPGGSGLTHVCTFDKTTGVAIDFITAWGGVGAGSLQDHDGSMAYNPADGNMYWADVSSPMSLGKIDHLTHVVTHTTTAITGYDTAGSIIFDNAGNLYVLCPNDTPNVLHKCDTSGVILATITLGLDQAISRMTYDPTHERIYAVMGQSVFVVDLATFTCLGSTLLAAQNHYSLANDQVRNKLAVAFNASGYSFLQM